MSREFGQTTRWIVENFDTTEYMLQTGWNLYKDEMMKRAKDGNN